MSVRLSVKLVGAASLLTLSACGPGQSFLKKVDLSTYSSGSDQYVSLKTQVDNAQIIMPIAQVPIVDSRRPGVIYGFVQISPHISSGTEFRLDLNMSTITNFRPQGWDGTLPNGLPVPVAGFDPTTSFALPISQGSRIYMNLDIAQQRAFIGAAIGVREFRTGITGGLFLPLPQGSIPGVAGLFTGAGAYQSGFAIFADISSVLQRAAGAQLLAATSTRASSANGRYAFRSGARNSSAVYNMLANVQSSRRAVNVQ